MSLNNNNVTFAVNNCLCCHKINYDKLSGLLVDTLSRKLVSKFQKQPFKERKEISMDLFFYILCLQKN